MKYIETAKKLLAMRIFFFLFILRFYCYSAKASEAVVKIAADEKFITNAPCAL